jgi:hypothetical protein
MVLCALNVGAQEGNNQKPEFKIARIEIASSNEIATYNYKTLDELIEGSESLLNQLYFKNEVHIETAISISIEVSIGVAVVIIFGSFIITCENEIEIARKLKNMLLQEAMN